MPLLKSLFCLHGYDNRLRFFVINFSIYLFALFSNAIFSAHISLSIIVLILLSVICAIATKRRLNDAELNNNWLFVPCCSFFVVQVIIVFNHSYAYWLLVLPISLTLFLFTYQGKQTRDYILGYCGPIDLSEYLKSYQNNKQQFSRIEPTINAQQHNNNADISAAIDTSAYNNLYDYSYSNQNPTVKQSSPEDDSKVVTKESSKDIGEQIRESLLRNKKLFKMYLYISDDRYN